MQQDQFIEFIKTPEKLNAGSSEQLAGLVIEYPYCNTAAMLYALNLRKENSHRYSSRLKIAAAYAPDRKKFKEHLLIFKSVKPEEKKIDNVPSPQSASLVETIASKAVQTDDIDKLLDQLKSEVKRILGSEAQQKDEKRARIIRKGLDRVIQNPLDQVKELKPDIKDYNFGHLKENQPANKPRSTKADLIDKFIENNPRLEKPKVDFFNPVDYARHSMEDNQNIVSETLAELYLKQGNQLKAIQIFEKLCLLYPEKNSFFAARIEKIRNSQIS